MDIGILCGYRAEKKSKEIKRDCKSGIYEEKLVEAKKTDIRCLFFCVLVKNV